MNCKSSCTEMCIRTAYKFLVTNKRLEQSSLFRIANIYRSINKRLIFRQVFHYSFLLSKNQSHSYYNAIAFLSFYLQDQTYRLIQLYLLCQFL